jgi:peptidoglycan pentaglycine glycine transferase (the first glycine)
MARFTPYLPQTGEPAWNDLIAALPGAHLLQTAEWGEVKRGNGWQPAPWVWRDEQGQVVGAALTLTRAVFRGLCVLYVPKGPLLDWSDPVLRRQALSDLADLGRRTGAIFIKIDLDVQLGAGIPGEPGATQDEQGSQAAADLRAAGWRFSAEQVQFRNTVLIDLRPDPESLLAQMKQKTRYNLRLAQRKGVTVRAGALDDLPLFYQMYAETAARDDFVIRDEAYYQSLWTTMMAAGLAKPLLAEVQGEPVAGVVIFHFAGRAWYMQGMSRLAHREKMPNYLLQWEAMLRAKASGCAVYDLWGAPDEFTEDDPLWGVYRFKEGLGGQVRRYLGAWDLPLKPVYYQLYTQILPRLLDVMRRRGKERTRRLVG